MFWKLTACASVSTFMISCATAGPLYDHQVLLTGIEAWSLAYLNYRGDWAANAHVIGEPPYPYLNGQRYGMDIPGVTGGLIRALNDRGDVLFQANSTLRDGQQSVFLNGVCLSLLVTDPYPGGEDRAVGLNESGVAVWNRDANLAIKHDRPLNRGPIYENYAAAMGINSGGQALWIGVKTSTRRCNVYIDNTLVSDGLPDYYAIFGAGIADTGDWAAEWEKGYGGTSRIIKNGVDISQQVLGDLTSYQARLTAISTSGAVLWRAVTSEPPYGTRVFIDTTDISTPVLGPDVTAGPFAINGHGVPLWRGGVYGQWTSWNMYSGSVSVTGDLFGLGWGTREGNLWPFDINDGGQVLWAYKDGLNAKWTLYLSTPIPEPSAALLLLPGAVLMLRHRRR